MTQSELASLGLNENSDIIAETALEWLKANTDLIITDFASLPPSARLFISKFAEVQAMPVGISSESIEGLSQSFASTADRTALIWQLAEDLLGNHIKSRVTFTAAAKRWC